MIHIKSVLERVPPLGVAATLLLASTVPTFILMGSASAAAPITNRSLQVTSSVASDDLAAPDGSTYTVGAGPGQLGPGDPRNGQQVGHTYTFTLGSTASLKAFTFEYCDSPFGYLGTCTVPSGFSAASWSGGTVSVDVNNSGTPETWNVASASANALTISNNTTAFTYNSGSIVTIKFTPTAARHFVNPDTDYLENLLVPSPQKATYFAHIETHNNVTPNAPSTLIDEGTVTNNVTTAIGIYTRVQETLNFSVEGEDQSSPDGPSVVAGTSCAPLTAGGQLSMGDSNDALAATQAYDAYSYFRLATNSSNGVSVSYSGDTLKTAGGLQIAAIGAAADNSEFGKEQFGLALDTTITNTNLTNLTAAAAYAGGDGTISDGTPANNASFAFNTASVGAPVTIANTTGPNGVVQCDTGAVRYVANIAPETPAGIYQTKINYIAAPSY